MLNQSEMTPKQAELLAYLKSYQREHGYPPTRTEIAHAFGWSSPNAADEHLRKMAHLGVLTLTRRVARGIRID